MRIDEEYKKSGYFWIPEKQEDKIPGVLTIKDGGNIELEIVGLFHGITKTLKGDFDLSRIIGHVENDGLVTLESCFYTQRNISLNDGLSKATVHVGRVLSGVVYDKDEDVTFNTLSFSVDCMDEWVGISGIKVDTALGLEPANINISYEQPKNLDYTLDNGMELEICFAYTVPGFPNLTEAKITQKAYFKLKSNNLRPLIDFTEIAYKIVNLLCFAMDETVSIKGLTATSSEFHRDGGDGKTYPTPVHIYYSSNPFTEKIPKRTWHQMLFSFGVIKDNAGTVFNNWLKAYETLSPALSLYFSTKNGAQKFLEGKFLALAQGLETYHRRTSDETLMNEDDFYSLVATVKKNCPEENINWLEGRLMHGNEINFNKRIKKIIDPFKEHLGTSRKRGKLLRTIVDTRNYLTHYNDDLKNKSASGAELWLLCLKMEVIFQLHFLRVIGFSDDNIKNVIENCYPLKRKIDGEGISFKTNWGP